MAVAELVEWIRDQLAAGVSENEIRTTLASQGWSDADIDAAMAEARVMVEKPIEGVKRVRKFIGPGLSLAAGLLVLAQFLDIRTLPLLTLGEWTELLTVLFGVSLIACAGLLWADKTKIGAGLILAFSVAHFILLGQITVLVIGILAGIMALKKR